MAFRGAPGRGLLLVALAIAATAGPARAQEPPPDMIIGIRQYVGSRNVVSGNPLALLYAAFNAEYERRVASRSTLGARFSTQGRDDDRYHSGRVFWRFHPSQAFLGFFFGVGLGFTRVEGPIEPISALAAGFELGFNWLLGPGNRFYVSLGAGADHLFGADLEDDASAILPLLRIVNIGLAF